MILFPSSYFDCAKVDEDLSQEFAAVLETGFYQTALFDYSKWFDQGILSLKNAPCKPHAAIYRGWMMDPQQYENFYHLLLKHNIELVTTPSSYNLMHLFPNVYNYLAEDTARLKIYPLHSPIDVEELKKEFHRFMVKDFVKSVKGTQFPKYFDSMVTQSEFDQWMDVFYKYRGDLLTGGIVVKEFLDLKFYHTHSNEYRVFYMNHRPAVIAQNSDQPPDAPFPPQNLIEKYSALDSPFYTVDYAELTDGSWRIIETGDGGVSGIPESCDYIQFFQELHKNF